MNEFEKEIIYKKRWLRRYKNNLACIHRLSEKLYLLDSRIKSIKTSNYSAMPKGGQPVTIDDLMSDKLDLEKRLNKLKRKKYKLKNEILEEIDRLDDSRYCEVLESYFIDCKTLEDIADDEGYTVRHIYRLYSDAIKSLTVISQ